MSWPLQPHSFPILDTSLDISTNNGWQYVEVPVRNLVNLDGFCKHHGVSPLSFFKVAWALVLRCYAGSDSPSFSCLNSASELEQFSEPSRGLACHIRDCHVELDGAECISKALQAVQSMLSEDRQYPPHEPLPLHNEQVNGVHYDTALLFRELEILNGFKTSHKESADQIGQWDHIEILLDVRFDNSNATGRVYLQYRPVRLSVAAATNVAHTCGKAIECMLDDPFQLINDLDLMTKRDLEQLLRWETEFPERIDVCVHDLVLKHAISAPNSPALCSWDGQLSYGELEKATSVLARHFVDRGVRPETLVPICFEKSVYAILAMLGVLRAGGAFVPLDPSQPKERLEAIIKKVDAKLIITSAKNAHIFNGTAKLAIVVVSGTLLKNLSTSSHGHLAVKVKPYSAAFVLFTSGSTGEPKGIVQEHSSVSTSSLAHGKALDVSSRSRVLQYAAYTFDVSMMDIFTTLIFGGCVCTPSEDDRRTNIVGIMNTTQVNWVLFTPSVANLISPEDVPCLETLVLGGEAVTQENVSRWAHAVKLYNCYGPAECAATTITAVEPSARGSTIGRTFGSALCWVVDSRDHNRLVPIGAVGELVVEGPTLARGYIDDREKTRAAFIKDARWPSEVIGVRTRRFYKTGDLVRYNSDGSLDFIGRKDFQVKIRGQRVELGEVEHHLSTYSGVSLAIAASPKAGPYAKSLVAVVQIDQRDSKPALDTHTFSLLDHDQLAAEGFRFAGLTQFMKTKLPSYMVPNHWLAVERIPLSVSGKINRKLVEAWLAQLTRDSENLIPANHQNGSCFSKEDLVGFKISTRITSLVYQNDTRTQSTLIGQDVMLEAIGFDSIQMISLIMFIRQEFSVNLHISALLHPKATIKSITQHIEQLKVTGANYRVEKAVDIMTEFEEYKQQMLGNLWGKGPSIQNILLTGATGFLGSQILFQLCERGDVKKVMVHVRAKNSNDGLQRIKTSAMEAGWWSEAYLKKIEVWVGDLAQTRLGLHSDQWDCLSGNTIPSRRIHGIIHCGAKVHWSSGFSSLKPANVDSTWILLNVVHETPSILKFVYISGGYNGPSKQLLKPDVSYVDALPTGYAQTKFLSQLLVEEYSQSSIQNQSRVSIVKPSFIIGTIQHGIANVDDFLWRLVAGCIQIGSYNEADADSWLFISDAGHVARTISDCCDTNADTSSGSVVEILEGLSVGDFWSVLKRDFGYILKPLSQERWLDAIMADIELKHEVHPLWPLIHSIEKDCGRVGMPLDKLPRELKIGASSPKIEVAIRKNVEYLRGTGFLPNGDEII